MFNPENCAACLITDEFYECPNCHNRNPTVDINIPIVICDDCSYNRTISEELHELLKKGKRVKIINLNEDPESYASYCKKLNIQKKRGKKKRNLISLASGLIMGAISIYILELI